MTDRMWDGRVIEDRSAINEGRPSDPDGSSTEQAKFSATAANHFGSGWAWLVKQGDKLEVVGTHDAGNPLKDGTGTPLLTAE